MLRSLYIFSGQNRLAWITGLVNGHYFVKILILRFDALENEFRRHG